MRLADILLDLAVVGSASRSVASKHLALRIRQLDRYRKTSIVLSELRTKERVKLQREAENAARKTTYAPTETSETSTSIGTGGKCMTDCNRILDEDKVGSSEAPVDLGCIPSMRGGSIVPSSVPPASGSGTTCELQSHLRGRMPAKAAHGHPENQKQEKAGSGFVPAVWAKPVLGNAGHPTSPDIGKLRTNPYGVGGLDGVDVNIFRRARTLKVVDGLRGLGDGDELTELADSDATEESPLASEQTASRPEEESIVKDQGVEITALARGGSAEECVKSTEGTSSASVPPPPEAPVAVPTLSLDPGEADQAPAPDKHPTLQSTPTLHELRESSVPSSRFGRIWNYSSLAAGMFAGAVGEGLSRAFGGGGEGSVLLSAANMERLVARLSRMRGAALKLGQMMSFQDAKMLPTPIQEVLQRVQDRADYMPGWQRDRVLATNLGTDWRDLFESFDEKPMAAASIGQVHRAKLKSTGVEVAVKIQFPGVADSINSDLDNLSLLLAATKLLPKGLYLDKTIKNARTELAWECDYEREARCGQRYRELLADESGILTVPQIFSEACGRQVLTMEFMRGVAVTRFKCFTQEQRDWIGTQILRLCLREMTDFRFMQTDPNWTNFLYNAERNHLELLDFGASREYPDEFIVPYVRLLDAASRADKPAVKVLSEQLGYLTGHESRTMLEAHITSVMTLAEPFMQDASELYDFSDQTITKRVKAQIPVMIRERLAPPPEETYSLHRKLSGAFLLCARLGSRVRCRDMFREAVERNGLLVLERR